MNVLYVSYDGALDPLGRSQVVPYLEGLSSEGFRYDLITFEKTARWNDLDDRRSMEERLSRADIRWHPLRYRRRPPVLGTLLNLVEGYRLALRLDGERAFDLVHARSYPSSVVARRLKTRRRIPFIFDMRGFYPEERVDGGLWKKGGVLFKAAKRVERDLFGMADGIVTLTQASLPILSTRIAAAGGRAVPRVIPTCVDLDRFKPVPTGTRPEEFTLAYFGSLGTWYRLGDMLRFGRYVLEAAGGGRLLFLTNDDPSPVQRLAAEAGMPPEVLSVGSVPHEDVPAALAGAHATFFLIRSGPSRFGFHQTKLGESLALGLPVAANAGIGDTAEILEGNRVGIVIDESDEDGLRRSAAELVALAADPSTPERCRGVGEREYDRALGVRRYAALYRDLVDRVDRVDRGSDGDECRESPA